MKKSDIALLAECVLSYLQQLPNGAEISTHEAVTEVYKAVGQELIPDWEEYVDLFDLHVQVCLNAKRYRLKLDDSKYHDMTVGLPYCIPYIVSHT